MQEPWNTILFLAAIPIVQQLIKLYFDKTGKTLGKLANQAISFVLASGFMIVSGGFAGLELPVWDGNFIQFAGDVIEIVGVAWGSLMVLYEAIWDRLFVAIKLATDDKY